MNLFLKYAAFAAVATSVTLASCNNDDDDPVAVENRDPTVEIQNADGTANDSAQFFDVKAGQAVGVNVVATDPDGNLNTITFDVNGTQASVGTVRVGDATTPTGELPLLISGDKSNSSTVYYFPAPPTAGDSLEYTVTVQDADGLTASEDFKVYAAVPLTELTGVLLNAAGPQGTGGIVLSTGTPVGSVDSSAGIIDRGIDDAIDSQVNENWIQKISPGSEAILHIVKESYLTENQAFAAIENRSQIQAAFEATGDDTQETPVVEVGNVFAVLKDNVYYLVEVSEVKTANQSNGDSYTLNIKY